MQQICILCIWVFLCVFMCVESAYFVPEMEILYFVVNSVKATMLNICKTLNVSDFMWVCPEANLCAVHVGTVADASLSEAAVSFLWDLEDKSIKMIPILAVFGHYLFTLASMIVNPQLAIPGCLCLSLLTSQGCVFLMCPANQSTLGCFQKVSMVWSHEEMAAPADVIPTSYTVVCVFEWMD